MLVKERQSSERPLKWKKRKIRLKLVLKKYLISLILHPLKLKLRMKSSYQCLDAMLAWWTTLLTSGCQT